MSVVLDLPPDLESVLAAEAAQRGLALPEYILRLLAAGRSPAPRTGDELLIYWRREGLVGTRADITDPDAHARALRERAGRRDR
ncbi:MAG TPA: hypothetical protein VFG68_00020 [Fimbriiglobus sp.]|nr:hypothetical protein [Fimbriiglobus sp.]